MVKVNYESGTRLVWFSSLLPGQLAVGAGDGIVLRTTSILAADNTQTSYGVYLETGGHIYGDRWVTPLRNAEITIKEHCNGES